VQAPEWRLTWFWRLVDWLTQRRRRPVQGEGEERVKSRPVMDRVLKETVLPELRALGFTGSLPHLRRLRSDRIDLVTFQYSRYGGQFVVELSQCGPGGIKTGWGKEIPANKVTAHDLFSSDRYRLRPRAGSRDQWFVFDHDPPSATSKAAIEASCRKAATAALEAFGRQAEAWWVQKAGASKPDVST
jgi:hypothetical protein